MQDEYSTTSGIPGSASSEDAVKLNEIVTELGEKARWKQEIIQSLLEPCDRKTYGQRQREAAQKLGASVRTVRRLVKKWEEKGLEALAQTSRTDKGKHRIDDEWQEFIIKTYKDGNKGSKRITPNQVAVRVQARAAQLGEDKYPSYRTVYRVLKPIIERQKQTQNIRSRGWRGSRLSVKTRTGQDLSVEYSNHVWQCDHTRVDVLLVDQHGQLLGRPWLTTVVDTYSRCIMGINLGFDAPSSQVVALALRHAILPKQYREIRCAPSKKGAGLPQRWLLNHLRARRNPLKNFYILTGRSEYKKPGVPSKVGNPYLAMIREVLTVSNRGRIGKI